MIAIPKISNYSKDIPIDYNNYHICKCENLHMVCTEGGAWLIPPVSDSAIRDDGNKEIKLEKSNN